MPKYVHGYSERETERLQDQSGILESILHEGTSYPPGSTVLEAGCGVGAQTLILARRSPGARFVSVDISQESIETSRRHARNAGIANVMFARHDIMDLPFPDGHFDHVFVCFVLEHLDSPAAALLALKRVLRPGGTLTAIEGDHGSCFWHPETPDGRRVWESFIEVQRTLGHDPNIGRRVCPLLVSAGFELAHTSPRFVYGDAMHGRLLDGMVNRIIVPMCQTGRDRAIAHGLIDPEQWERGIADIEHTGIPPGGTFFYTWFKAVGRKAGQ
ncbi:MAG: methyltransferase domain-containing protein [Chitinivibrionales bacterium]|nr:methyltransferase domain-containing protein [Chitinivibrionales bacterium]MBD3395413.1 methyltransferase domain-containing protein [Chitinivibrionales bacterium]